MCLPAKIKYDTTAEYLKHFVDMYCLEPIYTFDGIPVRFKRWQFDHCMYESTHRDDSKDRFSEERAERIDWIKATLQDGKADLFQGWDSKKKRTDPFKRVAVVDSDYVVIINIRIDSSGNQVGDFVTAYVADSSIGKIRANPRWSK